jgi:hypothetical protein
VKPAAVLYIHCIDRLRELAKEHGYALAVHGSMARDLDLIAVPWREDVTDPYEFAVAFQQKLKLCTGEKWHPSANSPSQQPHGRIVWNFVPAGGGGVYIDLGVIAPQSPKATCG